MTMQNVSQLLACSTCGDRAFPCGCRTRAHGSAVRIDAAAAPAKSAPTPAPAPDMAALKAKFMRDGLTLALQQALAATPPDARVVADLAGQLAALGGAPVPAASDDDDAGGKPEQVLDASRALRSSLHHVRLDGADEELNAIVDEARTIPSGPEGMAKLAELAERATAWANKLLKGDKMSTSVGGNRGTDTFPNRSWKSPFVEAAAKWAKVRDQNRDEAQDAYASMRADYEERGRRALPREDGKPLSREDEIANHNARVMREEREAADREIAAMRASAKPTRTDAKDVDGVFERAYREDRLVREMAHVGGGYQRMATVLPGATLEDTYAADRKARENAWRKAL